MANDTDDDGMQCSDHPYSKNPGGICAFCLQENLDKLLSSSAAGDGGNPFSFLRPQPSFSSSSDSPSFRSDYGATQRKKVTASSSSASNSNFEGFKRRKSVASRSMSRVSNAITTVDTPWKKSIWAFLHFSSSSSSSSSSRGLMQQQRKESTSNNVQTKIEKAEVVAESSSSFGSKVARSRSVGCGSRSFSGDFLERISTGFGDCTLRRVESHRERNKDSSKKLSGNDMQRIKERVGCARIFIGGGYDFDSEIGLNTARASTSAILGGRNRGWGWAFAIAMGSFKPAKSSSSSSSKSYASNNASASIDAATAIGDGRKNGEVGANPSLLTVGR